jgi:stage V sporulation protein G
MKITEVRIFPKEGADKKLKAFATITFDDCFVVRDIKIIEGNKGYFVAMPSRRMKDPCPKCGHGNVARSRYCNQCGATLPSPPELERPPAFRADRSGGGIDAKHSEHKDVAHPITVEFREYIQKIVLEAYEKEKHKLHAAQSEQPQNQ